jgi:hypothetical protein
VEKIDYLLWRQDGLGVAQHRRLLLEQVAPKIVSDGALALTVLIGDTDEEVPKPTLLLGRGPELAAVVCVWLDSIDDRGDVEDALRAEGAGIDGYLVTESVPQHRSNNARPDGQQSPGITHFTWFPKPDRLTDEEFFRGWHDVHTPSTQRLHPTRLGYTRDTVARVMTPGSPQVNAIVFEYFTVEDYTDPRRLYGSKEAIDETVEHLPRYADYESLNSRPLHEVIVKRLF